MPASYPIHFFVVIWPTSARSPSARARAVRHFERTLHLTFVPTPGLDISFANPDGRSLPGYAVNEILEVEMVTYNADALPPSFTVQLSIPEFEPPNTPSPKDAAEHWPTRLLHVGFLERSTP
jgi:hypothetical protein